MITPVRALALAGALAVPITAQTDNPRAVEATVDPRIELFSLIFRLAGNPEYNQARVASYSSAVDERFGELAGEPVVALAKQLRRSRGIGFDAVMGLALHTTDARELGEAVPLDPRPAGLDRRWTPADAKRFLREARRFSAKVEFTDFFDENAGLYEIATERMQDVLDGDAQLDWFDEFFGARPTAKFSLALGMLNGGANYGPRVIHEDGREDLHAVIGVWKTDDDGLPVFDESMLGTVVHEFCHSYCNRIVDAHLGELRSAGEKLWPVVANDMTRQAYGNWQTMMRESLVRACVVRYLAAHAGRNARRLEIAAQKGRKFLWVGELSDVLAEYEGSREDYSTLDAFFPNVVEFFDRYTEDFEVPDPPKVVAMSPANGSSDVDPATTALVVTFDRRMKDGAWAVVGGGPNFPELTGKLGYDESRKVLTIPTKLKPEWSYELWLNRGRYSSFQSEDGVVLESVHVRFETGKAR